MGCHLYLEEGEGDEEPGGGKGRIRSWGSARQAWPASSLAVAEFPTKRLGHLAGRRAEDRAFLGQDWGQG